MTAVMRQEVPIAIEQNLIRVTKITEIGTGGNKVSNSCAWRAQIRHIPAREGRRAQVRRRLS